MEANIRIEKSNFFFELQIARFCINCARELYSLLQVRGWLKKNILEISRIATGEPTSYYFALEIEKIICEKRPRTVGIICTNKKSSCLILQVGKILLMHQSWGKSVARRYDYTKQRFSNWGFKQMIKSFLILLHYFVALYILLGKSEPLLIELEERNLVK
jgi:hypothetical protein